MMQVDSRVINVRTHEQYGRQVQTNISKDRDDETNWTDVIGDCFNPLEDGAYKIVFNKERVSYMQLETDKKKKLFFESIISAILIKKKDDKPKQEQPQVEVDGLPF